MNTDRRLSLSRLERDAQVLRLLPASDDAVVDLNTYSRFKYGDGAASDTYGRALAHLALGVIGADEPLMVTSSGFGFVPPAAHSLVEPFCDEVQRNGGRATPFRVLRSTVSNGDYASMSLAERREAMSHHALSVTPGDIPRGAHVIALDDVRVTGVHEESMDSCLRAAGSGWIDHIYIVDAWDARHNPSTEAMLNASGVTTTAELLSLAQMSSFLPNARFCKRVLGMPPREMESFLSQISPSLVEWIDNAVDVDNLAQYEAYAGGVVRLREHLRLAGASVSG